MKRETVNRWCAGCSWVGLGENGKAATGGMAGPAVRLVRRYRQALFRFPYSVAAYLGGHGLAGTQ